MSEDFDLGGYAEPSGESGNYMKAADIPAGQIVSKTVEKVSLADFDDGQKPVLHFEDGTALVLIKTNAGHLAELGYGNLGDCVGLTLKLNTAPSGLRDPNTGKMLPGIRIAAVE